MKLKCLLLSLLFSLATAEDEAPPTPPNPCEGRMALVTGGTGQVGGLVTQRLLAENYCVRVLTRNETKAKEKLGGDRIEIVVGQLGDDGISVAKAFEGPAPVSHVIFTAGGEDADFDAVNNRGVAECARALQASSAAKKSMVVISAAWVSKPYSMASILFNALYDNFPMAKHLQGEDVLRKTAAESKGFHYAILRAGRLVSDEEYPDKGAKGLLYQQGDSFFFFGPAGSPGISYTQLAESVMTAMKIEKKVTVEITGGITDVDDTSIYAEFREDNALDIVPYDDVEKYHANALWTFKVCGIVYLILLGFLLLQVKSVLAAPFLLLASAIAFFVVWTKVLGVLSVFDCANESNKSAEL